MDGEREKTRRWQFGLRDLAWLTLVVALCLGWYLDRQSLRKSEVQVLDEEARAKAIAHDARQLSNQAARDFDHLSKRYQRARD